MSATIRMPSGIASARVGLGSPKLIFNRDWARGRRNRSEEIERASVEEEAIAEEAAHFLAESAAERQREERGLNGLVDRVSGLPSPPRTESGIALLDVPARGFGSRALAEMVR